MSTQPTLPPPDAALSEIEAAYLEEQPPGLWPINQDSNFGIHRKVFCGVLSDAASQLDLLLNEKFVATSSEFLWLHEEELGVPENPTGKTIDQRRAVLFARMKRGPFTNALRASIIETFIIATFGPAPQLLSSGLDLQSGIQLFSGEEDVTGTYEVVEDVENFSYTVYILNTITVDNDGLTRELARITPSGISFTISYVSSLP